jgi:GNAT superfamily N-acetyltransferase
LVRTAEEWARERGCRVMKIETQNINVPACRFYHHLGYRLRAIDRFAYPDLPDEVQLVWFKEL